MIRRIMHFAIFLVLISSAVYSASGCLKSADEIKQHRDDQQAKWNQEYYDFGKEAYEAKVPANANPYQYSNSRYYWLKGWIDASNKDK